MFMHIPLINAVIEISSIWNFTNMQYSKNTKQVKSRQMFHIPI